MTYDAQRNSVQSRFDTQFKVAHPGVAVFYDNLKSADKPESGYVQLSILNGDSFLRGLGLTKLYRYAGVISVDIYLPQKTGIKIADQYADTIDNIFRGQSFDGLLCRATQRNDIGIEGNFWRTNVSIPFQRDELLVI